MLRSVALGAALMAFAAGGNPVLAADIGSYPAPVPVPDQIAYDWSGFYVGAHGGYGWSDWDVDLSNTVGALIYNDPFDPDQVSLDASNGWLGGVHAGFNHQAGPLVLGLEADYAWTGLRGEGTFFTSTAPGTAYQGYPYGTQWDITTKLDHFGTARARIGVAQGPVMFYGTGGLAWGQVSATQATTHPDPLCCGGTPGAQTSGDANHIGYAVGAGLEWMFARNWTVRAEYLFADLGKASYVLDGTTSPSSTDPWRETFATDLKLHSVRVGVTYKFGN